MQQEGLTASALVTHLRTYEIRKSLSQVYRLRAKPPAMLILLAALCEVLRCTPNDLVALIHTTDDDDLPPPFGLIEP